MTNLKDYLRRWKPLFLLILLSTLSGVVESCKTEKKQDQKEVLEIEQDKNIIVKTVSMDFQMPDTIPSGWNTFVYMNESPQTHFFQVDKYPEGKTIEDIETQVLPYFDSGMKLINEGKGEEAMAEFGKLPEWFGELVVLGGSALLSPGQTSETTILLEPGIYFIECYVKMSNGIFHTSMGMLRKFVVSDVTSGIKEPSADFDMEISSTDGMVINDSITSGKHTFSVFFKDQIVHENFIGHDVNLVRINEGGSLEELEKWMNWADPKGLIEPAPEGLTFLGGVNNMPAGHKGYFTVDLDPGSYALIAEVPNAKSKNMLKTFEVLE